MPDCHVAVYSQDPQETVFNTVLNSNYHQLIIIPKLLYPHTKFPSECCTPIYNSLVEPVRGYNIRIVD